MRIVAAIAGVVALALAGVVLAIRYPDRGRAARLEKCIDTKRPLIEEGLKEIGLRLGDPEIWLTHPEVEEFATFPIEGDKPGGPKRFFRVHSGDGPAAGESFCRAGMIDESKSE